MMQATAQAVVDRLRQWGVDTISVKAGHRRRRSTPTGPVE
jgi:hypothetical protein